MNHNAKLFVTVLMAIATGAAMAQQPVQQKKDDRPTMQQANPNRPHEMERPRSANGEMHHHNPQHDGKHKHGPRQPKPTEYNADGIDMAIVRAFPTVKKVSKKEKMTEVYDADGKLLGYALYSKPASDGIKGYNGETPLLIALSPKKKVLSVEMLGNIEGGRFVAACEQAGLFKSWNGLKVKKAKKKKVDTVSGATFTSRAVIQTMQKALDTL